MNLSKAGSQVGCVWVQMRKRTETWKFYGFCWNNVLVSLPLALCLENVKSFRDVCIGISCGGEAFKHYLAGQKCSINSSNSVGVVLQC